MRITEMTVALALASTIGVAACSDPTTIDEHLEVEGIAIENVDGVEIYRFMIDDATEPPLELTQGVHDVAFVLLDHDGQPISEAGHDDEHEEHELRITIDDNTVLTWTEEDHAEAHDTVEFHGELNAVQEGTTDMEVCVPHGTHCDFRAVVPVTVNAPAQ